MSTGQLNTRRSVIAVLLVLLMQAGCSQDATPPPRVLGISLPEDLDTLDPHASVKLINLNLLFHFYEGLVALDPAMNVKPSLAAHWESVDARRWLFHLQHNVRFHSGKHLTAADVVYSFQRLQHSVDLGASEFLTGVKSVSAKDAYTIEIETDPPNGRLLNKVAFIAIIPEGTDPSSLAQREDGTGPYRLVSWDRGKSMMLVRHDGYWGQRPEFARVEFRFNQSTQGTLSLVRSGRCQLARSNSRELQAALGHQPGYTIEQNDTLYVQFLGFQVDDHSQSPLTDKTVRQAIYIGIDRPRLSGSLSTLTIPAFQPVPVFVFGYNPSVPEPKYSPEKAMGLLKQQGLPKGFVADLYARELLRETAAAVQAQLQAIGVRLQVKAVSDSEFFQARDSKKEGIYLSRMSCPTGDAGDLLDRVMYAPERDGISATTLARYQHPHVSEGEVVGRGEEFWTVHRKKGLQQMVQMFTEDMIWIPLLADQEIYVVDSSLNWRPRSDSFVFASEIRTRAPLGPAQE